MRTAVKMISAVAIIVLMIGVLGGFLAAQGGIQVEYGQGEVFGWPAFWYFFPRLSGALAGLCLILGTIVALLDWAIR